MVVLDGASAGIAYNTFHASLSQLPIVFGSAAGAGVRMSGTEIRVKARMVQNRDLA